MIRKRVLRSKRRIKRKALRSKTINKRIRKKSIRRRQKGGGILDDLSQINTTKEWNAKLPILNSHIKFIYKLTISNDQKDLLTDYVNERISLWSSIHNYCNGWTSGFGESVTNLDAVNEKLKTINPSFNLTYAICTQKLLSLETKKTKFESFKTKIEQADNDITKLRHIFSDISVQFKDELNNTGL
jgi:hypothetical protein